ncbi:MAG TPA: hypothetical protein VN461_21055 [Vicinamibacteria bacterium]|jgi:hypothetical protein|nr:hypothetical protein [Vicinamibacteria bacterium]
MKATPTIPASTVPGMGWMTAVSALLEPRRAALICISGLLLTTPPGRVHADQAEYLEIREAMTKLAPQVGKWNAAVKFFEKEGVAEEVGTWSIAFVLDGTYLEFQTERHDKDNPKAVSKASCYVTFNPRSSQYDVTYFYNRSALRVTETGEYDDTAKEFRTRGFIPLEDGVNDETVRTISNLKDPDKSLIDTTAGEAPRRHLSGWIWKSY